MFYPIGKHREPRIQKRGTNVLAKLLGDQIIFSDHEDHEQN